LAEAEESAFRNGAQVAGRMIRAEERVGEAIRIIEAVSAWQV